MYFFLVPFLVILTANTLFSLLQTTYTGLNQSAEIPLYKKDSPVLLLAVLAAVVTGFCILDRKRHNSSASLLDSDSRKLEKAALIIGGGLSLFFVLVFRAIVCSDSAAVNDVALEMLGGDFSTFARGGYLFRHPYQLGLAALLQAIYAVFGENNFIVFQLLNCTAIVFILHFLYRMAEELSGNRRTGNIAGILSVLLLPLFLYSTFVYGEVMALCFISGALYMTIRYLKGNEISYIIFAGLMMGPAVILKTNSYVAAIAICIILLLKALRLSHGWRWDCRKTMRSNAAGITVTAPMSIRTTIMTGIRRRKPVYSP